MSDLVEFLALLCCLRCGRRSKDEKDLEANESARIVSERWKTERQSQPKAARNEASREGEREGANGVGSGDGRIGQGLTVREEQPRQQRRTQLIQLTEAQQQSIRGEA